MTETGKHLWNLINTPILWIKAVSFAHSSLQDNSDSFTSSLKERGNPGVDHKLTAGSEGTVVLPVSETRRAHELFSPILKVKVKQSKVYNSNLRSSVCEQECVSVTERERGQELLYAH